MTRPLRIDLAGALYHVTSRGDRREDIFHDNSDRGDWLLSQFGQNRHTARMRYVDFVRAGVGQAPIWEGLRHQLFLGSEAFVEQIIATQTPDDDGLNEVCAAHRRALAKPLTFYETNCRDRREAMARAYLSGGYAMREIADHFQVHYATVSRAVRRLEAKERSG